MGAERRLGARDQAEKAPAVGAQIVHLVADGLGGSGSLFVQELGLTNPVAEGIAVCGSCLA
jgi:hypothetical protein